MGLINGGQPLFGGLAVTERDDAIIPRSWFPRKRIDLSRKNGELMLTVGCAIYPLSRWNTDIEGVFGNHDSRPEEREKLRKLVPILSSLEEIVGGPIKPKVLLLHGDTFINAERGDIEGDTVRLDDHEIWRVVRYMEARVVYWMLVEQENGSICGPWKPPTASGILDADGLMALRPDEWNAANLNIKRVTFKEASEVRFDLREMRTA